MIFLHDSVKTSEFKKDKKLTLLKNGVITMSQFVNLIEPKDDYVVIGPAVVAKSALSDFILEWKTHDMSLEKAVSSEPAMTITQDEIMDKLGALSEVFPEILKTVTEFRKALKMTSCPKCVKNRYLNVIASKVNELKKDGRSLGGLDQFVELVLEKYFPKRIDGFSSHKFDIEWLKPEEVVGLGEDVIDGLSYCFECVMKHISRAKVLYEEFKLGYPDHKRLMFDELTKGNKALEEGFILYMDAVGQLDMASCELVGDLRGLPPGAQVEMIELADKIRAARLLFQEDPTQPPDFDGLRLEVKKLQLKVSPQKAK